MCKCDPNKKTPYCGKGDCQWPPIHIEPGKMWASNCVHQWFKLKDLAHYPDSRPESTPGVRIKYPDKVGIMLVCGNCEAQKTIWEVKDKT